MSGVFRRPPHRIPAQPWIPTFPAAVAADPLPVPHQVSLAPAPLRQGTFTVWGLTRDTTPRTSSVQHRVFQAAAPLPQGSFLDWGPPAATPVQAGVPFPHQVTLAEDLRRLQRFRLDRHGGPAGTIAAEEDTTKTYPHQAFLAASRFPEGGYFQWRPPQDTFPRRFPQTTVLAPSRTPEGDFAAWGPPPTVTPLEGRIPAFTVVSAPSRYPDGDYQSWAPPQPPPAPTRIPPFQVVPAAEDPRRGYRYVVVRTGRPPEVVVLPDIIPGDAAIAHGAGNDVALSDAVGAAVSVANATGADVAVTHTVGNDATVGDATGNDVSIVEADH